MTRSLAAGGPLSDLGVHCIDALRYIVGQEIRSVSALANYDSHWVMEALATAALQFESGILGTVSVSARTPYQTYLEVAGETGVLSSVNALNVEHPPTVELRRGFDVIERREVSNARRTPLRWTRLQRPSKRVASSRFPAKKACATSWCSMPPSAALRAAEWRACSEEGDIHHRGTETERNSCRRRRRESTA